MAVVVRDSFNRANGAVGTADSGQAWAKSGDKGYYVSSSNCTGDSSGDAADFIYIDAGVADFELTAEVYRSLVGGMRCGAVFRATDASNYHVAFLYYDAGGSAFRFYYGRMSSGSFDGLTYIDPELTQDGWSTLKVAASSTSIKVYLDDTLHHDITSEFNATATKVGVLANGDTEHVDDFLVESGGIVPVIARQFRQRWI
jgi:hypothetical protein